MTRKVQTSRTDPTPSEIAALCRQIQLGWTEAERRRRRVNKADVQWTVPEVELLDGDPDESDRWYWIG